MYVCICMYVYVCMYMYVCMCMYMYVCVCIYVLLLYSLSLLLLYNYNDYIETMLHKTKHQKESKASSSKVKELESVLVDLNNNYITTTTKLERVESELESTTNMKNELYTELTR